MFDDFSQNYKRLPYCIAGPGYYTFDRGLNLRLVPTSPTVSSGTFTTVSDSGQFIINKYGGMVHISGALAYPSGNRASSAGWVSILTLSSASGSTSNQRMLQGFRPVLLTSAATDTTNVETIIACGMAYLADLAPLANGAAVGTEIVTANTGIAGTSLYSWWRTPTMCRIVVTGAVGEEVTALQIYFPVGVTLVGSTTVPKVWIGGITYPCVDPQATDVRL